MKRSISTYSLVLILGGLLGLSLVWLGLWRAGSIDSGVSPSGPADSGRSIASFGRAIDGRIAAVLPDSRRQVASAGEAAGVMDRYADAEIIAVQDGPVDADGIFSRLRLVRAESKYPYHRVDEILQQHPDGTQRLVRQHAMAADHILVVLDEDLRVADVRRMLAGAGLLLHRETGIPGGYLVHAAGDVTLASVPVLLEKASTLGGRVLFEPNYVYWHAAIEPDDPEYVKQWALAQINLPQVWGATQETTSVVVAVFDTGTTRWHEDLEATHWINEAEIDGSGVDDDGNGYVDDRYGWNFHNKTNDTSDQHGHGTHVHGIISAVGNNGIGISGVGWHIQTLPVPFMGPFGNGFASDAASGLYYVQTFVSRGVPIRVTNHSWGGGGFSEILSNAFAHVSGDVLHVAAAGNTGTGGKNNDVDPFYPAGFALPNMIAVANSTSTDGLNWDSNYGARSVHLAAPGASIFSTLFTGGYGYKSGTSMAAPQVAGVAALLMDAFPDAAAVDIRAALLAGVQPAPGLDGRVATGGRLDALGAFLAAGPVLEHTPHPNVDADLPAYEISVRVRPGRAFLEEAGVRLFWDTSADLTHVTTNIMHYAGDGVFTAMIPGRPEGNRVYYWIEAMGQDGKRVAHPAGAPVDVHAFDVTFPVGVHVYGLPNEHGVVSPSYGAHGIPWGSTVAFSAPAFTLPVAGTRWRNIGWDGAGSVPATGVTNAFSVVLRQTSYLAWLWREQFALAELSDPVGIVDQTRWLDRGSSGQTSVASAEVMLAGISYRFVGWWVGGVRQSSGGDRAVNPVVGIDMLHAWEAVARYVPATLDSDGDGLPDWWQWYYFGHLDYGAADDPDGDGYTNAQEYADRSDPTDPTSYPEGPEITVLALAGQIEVPGPWAVQAVVTDRVDIAVVLLRWRQWDDASWQTVRMEVVDPAAGIYAGIISGPDEPGLTFDYEIFAEDDARNASTTSVYRFAVDYPVLSFGPLDHALVLSAGDQAMIRVAVTNRGTAAWHWNAAYRYADPVTMPPPAGWTSGGPNNQWHVSDQAYFTAPYAWFCGDPGGGLYNDSMDASLYTPAIRLGASAVLRFVHWPEMEPDGRLGYENYYWDGAVVELSVDGGASYLAIEPEGGYPHRITPNPDSPFEGHRPCFGGATGGWHEAVFDLAAYAGETVQVRFRFGTDRWVEYRGWFVDDVSFTWEPDWLVAVADAGEIGPGSSGWVEWRVDAGGLAAGHYDSGWLLEGNAPLQQRITGAVALEVRAPASILIGSLQASDDPDNQAFVLRWNSETGRVYSLLSRYDLRADSWEGVSGYTNLAGGGEMAYTGRVGIIRQQFYRVVEREP